MLDWTQVSSVGCRVCHTLNLNNKGRYAWFDGELPGYNPTDVCCKCKSKFLNWAQHVKSDLVSVWDYGCGVERRRCKDRDYIPTELDFSEWIIHLMRTKPKWMFNQHANTRIRWEPQSIWNCRNTYWSRVFNRMWDAFMWAMPFIDENEAADREKFWVGDISACVADACVFILPLHKLRTRKPLASRDHH